MPTNKSEGKAYIIDLKLDKNSDVKIPFNMLEDTELSNIIFFNNAIYYPTKGKICSINLINSNYMEFICDKVDKFSIIEIVKKGFRIYNLHQVYDLEQNV